MGMKVTSLLKMRVNVLEESVIFLDALINEIEFSKTDIISVLSKFSNESSMKNLTFLSYIADFGYESIFYSRWKYALDSFTYYKSEEKEKMLQLGSFLGTTDAKTQISTINLYKTFFEKYKNNAAADFEKYGKSSSLFGLFLGASVFILLL